MPVKPPRRVSRALAAAALILIAAGCARATLVVPVRIAPEARTGPVHTGTPTSYRSAVQAIATVMVTELGLLLPQEFTLFVYPSRAAYAEGLAGTGDMSAQRAAEIAGYSVALGQHHQLFVNDGALRGARRRVWLAVVAHELTHMAQFELSGGQRGTSEQWLREGMADWVAARVLERLGEHTLSRRRARALGAVARALPALRDGSLDPDSPLDLVDLGRPEGWEARRLGRGGRATYPLAFLLTDALVRRSGFERLATYFRAFAETDDRFGHFQRAFGLSLAEFEAQALGQLREEIRRLELEPARGREPQVALDAGQETRVLDERDEEDGDALER